MCDGKRGDEIETPRAVINGITPLFFFFSLLKNKINEELNGEEEKSERKKCRRRQVQQQQQQHDQLQNMMTMMRRSGQPQLLAQLRPETQRPVAAAEPDGRQYCWTATPAAAAAADDVLRLVIHMEETDEEEEAMPKPVTGSVRCKISWQEESPPNRPGHRKMLKHIGCQQSASFETSCAVRLVAHYDEGTRSGRLTAPLSTASATRSGGGAHGVVNTLIPVGSSK